MKGSTLMIEAAHSSAGGDDGDQPLPDGALARNVGLLKAAVYTMSVMIVVGTIVLIGGLIWKGSQLPASSAGRVGPVGTFDDLDVAVPAGTTVRAVEIDGERMAVTLEGASDEIVIVDLRHGEVLGRIRLAPGGAGGTRTSP